MLVLIIGEEGHDPSGLRYERELAARGHDVRWASLGDVLAMLRCEDGSGSLRDHADRDDIRIDEVPRAQVVPDPVLDGVQAAICVATDYSEYVPLAALSLERAGIVLMNPAAATLVAEDKWQTHRLAARDALPVPRAAEVGSRTAAHEAADALRFPVVVKIGNVNRGIGVRLAADHHQLDAVLDELRIDHRPLMVEQYVECDGTDKRIIVVGGTIVGAMARRAKEGEFRANLCQGGSHAAAPISDDEATLALQVMRTLGLEVAGVDLGAVTQELPGREHLPVGTSFVIEANSHMGLAGFETATGVNAAPAIIDHLLQRATTILGLHSL